MLRGRFSLGVGRERRVGLVEMKVPIGGCKGMKKGLVERQVPIGRGREVREGLFERKVSTGVSVMKEGNWR